MKIHFYVNIAYVAYKFFMNKSFVWFWFWPCEGEEVRRLRSFFTPSLKKKSSLTVIILLLAGHNNLVATVKQMKKQVIMKFTTPDIRHTRHSPHQTFATSDIRHTRYSPHQTFAIPNFYQTKLFIKWTFGVVNVLSQTWCGECLVYVGTK